MDKAKPNRIIAHLDMDAFFASVEERYTPRFRGLPIVVGSDPKNGMGRGVVSTANYKAREYGIHSALPIAKAWQLSEEAKKRGKPEVIFLPVDFELYEKSSANIFRIICKYSDFVEPASIDEFYFDLSSAKNFKKAEIVCNKIKEEIRKEEKITCSVGIGPNKLISKIAAGFKKPDGMFVVLPVEAESFLESLLIRKIPGIGPKTAEVLNGLDIIIVEDLKKFSKDKLKDLFGKWGEDLYYKVRGIDDSPIVLEREAKSIGEQSTFEINTLSALFVSDELAKMCRSVFGSFRTSGFDKFKTIAITVRFSDFETKTSAKTLKTELTIKNSKEFEFEALKLVLPYFDRRKNPKLKQIRLIGVRIENLVKLNNAERQQNIFGDNY
jgi:DNA polymerase IV (DinB-like DNA polymerase)